MADLTITASNLVAGTGVTIKTGVAGVAIVAGDTVWIDATDNNNLKKGRNTGEAKQANVVGIALTSAALGETVSCITEGDLCFGTVLTIGTCYVVSSVSGLIAEITDVGAPNFLTIVGLATGTAVMSVKIVASKNAIV